MESRGLGVAAEQPTNLFLKPLTVDYKKLFTSLAKAVGHGAVGKWTDLSDDAAETLAALGVTPEPEELAYVLIQRSLTKAVFDLVGESVAVRTSASPTTATGEWIEDVERTASHAYLDRDFFEHPGDLAILAEVQTLLHAWLVNTGMSGEIATAVTGRLPTYFVYALHHEWRKHANRYAPLIESLNTPFVRAGEREWAWARYAAYLQRRVNEGMYSEPFSLTQLYIPPRAYYEAPVQRDSTSDIGSEDRGARHVVVDLERELETWVDSPNAADAIRVISGGPGSGKSSFVRVFAARMSSRRPLRTIVVPLHLIDPSKELVAEVGRFVRDEGILSHNPLDPDSPERELLLVFDGLDELASQGRAAAETARAFIDEVERTVERRNRDVVKLRVLFSGREVAVQESESLFRRPKQILTLLPYFVANADDPSDAEGRDEGFDDPDSLLHEDLRQRWWSTYGRLTGKAYDRLPQELARTDLEELTSQPLLNYLVALSFTRGKVNFAKTVNLNEIYADLVAAVHERGYEHGRMFSRIRGVTLSDFIRVLEEIALAAWHGDGRTTTVDEIQKHCDRSGLNAYLRNFTEGAEAGVTGFLAAFFFRKFGRRASGDATFVFTHRSFGEYLSARRIARAMDKILREAEDRKKGPDEGWDESQALKHWAEICGPSALSENIRTFLSNELLLRPKRHVAALQALFATLFGYVLRSGSPMELLQIGSHRAASWQARNAEEALLAALNGCAQVTEKLSNVEHPNDSAFAVWLRRTQGRGFGRHIVTRCLSRLDLRGASLHASDLVGADLHGSDLTGCRAEFGNFAFADLSDTTLSRAQFQNAVFRSARLQRANLNWAQMREADLRGADLDGATLRETDLEASDLRDAVLARASLDRTNLTRADTRGARLNGADLSRAKVAGTVFDEEIAR